jgi:hypothetical protein
MKVLVFYCVDDVRLTMLMVLTLRSIRFSSAANLMTMLLYVVCSITTI